MSNWIRGSCIGRGAFGTVSVGVDAATGDLFAVKSVDLASASPCQLEALENEIRILKTLSSPFIVGYLGDDTTNEGSPATSFRNLHMEYLSTGALADVAPDEAAVAHYAWCLVSALSYLHSRGIMHCDVKGKNVLSGPSSHKLADFGSAAEISSPRGASARGSPLWMAPEVMRGEHQGPESDVWSLGCTVIEMVTGKPAWGAEAYSVYRIGYSDELPSFPARLSSLGRDFLEKCLNRDYTKRWSCDQLLEHPFLSVRTQGNTSAHSSPRCVLDWFVSDFHDDREREEEETLNLGADGRIGELASGRGANWESDGWLVVRGLPDDGEGSWPEFFDRRESRSGSGASSEQAGSRNSNLNRVCLPVNDVVGQQNDLLCYCRCSGVKRLYRCSNYSFESDIYKFRSSKYFVFTSFLYLRSSILSIVLFFVFI